LFANPRPSYDDLQRIYANSESTKFWVNEFFAPMAEARREKIFNPRAHFIVERFPYLCNSRIADIGAGFGLFLEELRSLWPKAELTAIEPSFDMAQICRQKGFSVAESMLEAMDPSQGRFDLLTSFELFEHLHEPRAFLKKVHELLAPGGVFFLSTLNGRGFDIQLLWAKSKSVFPPHHLNFANPTSIAELFKNVGFVVQEVSTPGELDWDIVEGAYRRDGVDPGRLFRLVAELGDERTKRSLQTWIRVNNLSSHMRVIALKQ